jgi:hypothetical protein
VRLRQECRRIAHILIYVSESNTSGMCSSADSSTDHGLEREDEGTWGAPTESGNYQAQRHEALASNNALLKGKLGHAFLFWDSTIAMGAS